MLLRHDFFWDFQWFCCKKMTVLYLYFVVWGVTNWTFLVWGSNCTKSGDLCHYIYVLFSPIVTPRYASSESVDQNQGLGAKAAAEMTLLCSQSNHICNCGFILRILLNERLRFSKLLMVVWQQLIARLTSLWVNPSLILHCLNLLAKFDNSSPSSARSAQTDDWLVRARCWQG